MAQPFTPFTPPNNPAIKEELFLRIPLHNKENIVYVLSHLKSILVLSKG